MCKKIILLTSFILASHVWAETKTEIGNDQFVIGLSAGPTWDSGNRTQSFNLQPDVLKTYTSDNSNHVFPTIGLFVGWQKPLPYAFFKQPLLLQLGLSFVGAGHAELDGDVWEDGDPEFNNFNYAYKVNHTHFAFKGRLIGHCNRMFEPYISASMGLGFNRAYDFSLHPKIVEEVPAPNFSGNTTTTFTYTIGIGLQTQLTSQLQAAIGYEFADWGKVQLARAPGQTQHQGLTLNNLYAHQLELALFYIV